MAPAATTAEAASSSSASGDQALLLQLPLDLLCRAVIQPHMTAEDKQAMRQASRLCRQLVNAAASAVLLDASLAEHAAAAAKLPSGFPGLRHVSIINTVPPAPSSSSSSGGGCLVNRCSAAAALQEQLPALLCQLPCLSVLSYEGPADRRQPGLDITPALAALAAAAPTAATTTAAAAAAAAPPSCSGALAAPALGSSSSSSLGNHHQQQQQQQSEQVQPRQQQLTQLELRAGKLPDGLIETVGRLRCLRCLQLTATSAINTSPLSALIQLSQLQLTVTPPLWAALAPLTGLTALATLHMAAISPAKGWGAALQTLPAGSLQELVLVFADVCDADMAGVAALSQLTHLDLHCSRHLSPAAIPHLARLRKLQVLHLEHTGCQLSHCELSLLGAGCRQLTQLHAEFDLRGLQEPPPPPQQQLLQLQLPHGGLAGSRQAGSQCAWIARGAAAPVADHQQEQELAPAGGDEAAKGMQPQHAQQQQLDLQERFSSLSSNLGSGSPDAGSRLHLAAAAGLAAAAETQADLHWPPLQHLAISSGCSLNNVNRLLHHSSGALKCLQLEGLGPNGNGVAEALAGRAPQLTALQLSGCSSMGEAHCLLLGQRLQSLQSLWLRETSVPAAHLAALLAGLAEGPACRQGGCCEDCCVSSDSSSVEKAACSRSSRGWCSSGCSAVTHLRFERCSGLDDQVVRGVLPRLHALRQLEVVACDAVSEVALLQLAGSSAVRLVVSGCKGVGPGFSRSWQRAAAEQRWRRQWQI